MGGVVFQEKQRFRQGWLWLLVMLPLLAIVPLMLFGLHQQLVLGKPFGNNPVSDRELLILAPLMMAIPLLVHALLWWAELDVQVTTDAIRVKFRPFHFSPRTFAISTIRSCEAVEYRPLAEYGGWGIRMGGARDWAYNVSGRHGVRLEFDDGRRLLIGSRRSDELAAAINARR